MKNLVRGNGWRKNRLAWKIRPSDCETAKSVHSKEEPWDSLAEYMLSILAHLEHWNLARPVVKKKVTISDKKAKDWQAKGSKSEHQSGFTPAKRVPRCCDFYKMWWSYCDHYDHIAGWATQVYQFIGRMRLMKSKSELRERQWGLAVANVFIEHILLVARMVSILLFCNLF